MLKNKRKWTIDARISYPLSNYLAGSYVTGLPFSKSCQKFGPERKGNRIFCVVPVENGTFEFCFPGWNIPNGNYRFNFFKPILIPLLGFRARFLVNVIQAKKHEMQNRLAILKC